jgi:hypothetical protein
MLSDPPCTCGRDEGVESISRRHLLGHNNTCAALDSPGTTFILLGVSPHQAAIVAALGRVFDPSASWASRGVEAIVLFPATAPDALEKRVYAALRHTEGAVSYRGEPFERTSLVRSSAGGAGAAGEETGDVDAAVRMAAGVSVVLWRMRAGEPAGGGMGSGAHAGVGAAGGARGEVREAGGEDNIDGGGENVVGDGTAPEGVVPPPVLRAELLAAQASRCWSDVAADDAEKGDVEITFIVQYYRRPALITRIVAGLAAGTRAALDRGGRWEVLIANDDGGGDDGTAWSRALSRVSARDPQRMRWRVVHAGNLHEIRTYARLSRLAAGAAVVFMQDDDVPPAHGRWIRQSLALFRRHPRLALLGGQGRRIQGLGF